MWAVLSDIHANLEALDAVLADVAKHPVSHIFCLGDVLGYGPNPIECLERALAWDVTLLGDHDQAVIFEPANFNSQAVRAVFWQRAVLEAIGREDLWEFLSTRPRSYSQGDYLFVHGSPRNPINDYIFPEDIYNQRKMTRVGPLLDRYCICGHTHIPGVFVEPGVGPENWAFVAAHDCDGQYRLDGRKSIVNVGSVGQPRDGDWRACYALVDGWEVTFRRVEYDFETVIRKVRDIPDLGDFPGSGPDLV